MAVWLLAFEDSRYTPWTERQFGHRKNGRSARFELTDPSPALAVLAVILKLGDCLVIFADAVAVCGVFSRPRRVGSALVSSAHRLQPFRAPYQEGSIFPTSRRDSLTSAMTIVRNLSHITEACPSVGRLPDKSVHATAIKSSRHL
jgi:hypothetical protein